MCFNCSEHDNSFKYIFSLIYYCYFYFTKVIDVETHEIPSTALSMEFFDKLYEAGILRENGSIKACMPEYLDSGLEINNELTKVT